MSKLLKRRLFMLLFSLPFAGVGVGLLLFSLVPNLYDWQQMKSWPQVEGRLLEVDLIVNRDDEGSTYRATARYRYRFQGMDYTGERVAIMGGSDNIGSFQKVIASELKKSLNNQRPVPVWVNPDQPDDAVLNRDLRLGMLGFKLIFALVFGGIGIGLVLATFFAKSEAIDHPEASTKPWLGQTDWAQAEIPCNTKNSLWFFWGFALIWNLVAIPASLAIPLELAKGNSLALIALIFPAAGIYLLVWAIKSTLSWRRFGPVTLQLDPYPGSIGGQVGGTVELHLPFRASQRFPVHLRCIRTYKTGSGKARRTHESTIWEQTGLAWSEPGPHGHTRLSICFDVPKDLPASEPPSNDYRHWELELNADLPGVDLQRQFDLPVFATGESSRNNLPLSTQHPQLAEEHEAQIDNVANIEQIPGGLSMYFPMLYHWGNNLIGLVCGLFFAGAGLLIHTRPDAPAIIVWAFTSFGSVIALICLKWLFTSLHVQLDHNGLISQRYWLGIAYGRAQIPRAQIMKLQMAVSWSGRTGNGYKESCKIVAHTNDNKKILVAMNLPGKAAAQTVLEAIGSLSGYKTT